MKPKVTVLLPVYNGAQYLGEAIDSILGQSFQDFELLIINDGSTDNSLAIINSYHDPRIRLINQTNQGLSATLNHGLALAQGDYIARMDADDISLPERLAKQVKFMDRHPTVGVCGSWVIFFNEKLKKQGFYPTEHEAIRAELLFGSPLAHPSVILRASCMREKQLVYWLNKSEDYELWIKADQAGLVFANLPEFLLKYRLGAGISATTQKQAYRDQALLIMTTQLARLGLTPSAEELADHQRILIPEAQPDLAYLQRLQAWLAKLDRANQAVRLYPVKIFRMTLADKWFIAGSRFPVRELLFNRQLLAYSLICFYRLSFFRKLLLLYKIFR